MEALSLIWLIVVICLILLCLLPGFIASSRNHENSGWVWVLTIFLGWSGIVWIIALIWAIVGKTKGADVALAATVASAVAEARIKDSDHIPAHIRRLHGEEPRVFVDEPAKEYSDTVKMYLELLQADDYETIAKLDAIRHKQGKPPLETLI